MAYNPGMTTEDDFQAALDAHPDDWQTRLVFADWLEDRDDPRAEGYRALGACQLSPFDDPRIQRPPTSTTAWSSTTAWWRNDSEYPKGTDSASLVPGDWFDLIDLPASHANKCKPVITHHDLCRRRICEDVAALAFAKLPAERRAELLATVPA